MLRMRTLKSSASTSAMPISFRHWITQHLGFSIGPPGPNGMNAMVALPFPHFRCDGEFRVWSRLLSRISSPPNLDPMHDSRMTRIKQLDITSSYLGTEYPGGI